jgi:small subunit ribosomal protein S8
MKEHILEVMKSKKFIEDVKIEEEGSRKILTIKLSEKYPELHVKRVSKPGQRIYVKTDELKQIKSGLGITIISTPKGVMSNLEARKAHLGGELLCEVY